MLKSSKLRLIEVAYRTGFANQAHFTMTFKKWTGLSPSEYRKRVDLDLKLDVVRDQAETAVRDR